MYKEKGEIEKRLRTTTQKGRTPGSWLYYSGYADDDFYILYL